MKNKRLVSISGISALTVFAIGIIGLVVISNSKEMKKYDIKFFNEMCEQMYELDGVESEPSLLCIDYRFGKNEDLRGRYYFNDEEIIEEFISLINENRIMEISQEEYDQIVDDGNNVSVSLTYPRYTLDFRWQETKEAPLVYEVEQMLFPMDFDWENTEYYSRYGKYKDIDLIVEKFVEKYTRYITMDDVIKIASEDSIDFFDFSIYRSEYVSGGNSYFDTMVYPVENTEYETQIRISVEWISVENVEMNVNGQKESYKGNEIIYNMPEVWLCHKNGSKINIMEEKNIEDFINSK